MPENVYYTDINELPILNWFKCSEGNLGYLYKGSKAQTPLPWFSQVLEHIFSQFEFVDMKVLNLKADIQIIKNSVKLNEAPRADLNKIADIEREIKAIEFNAKQLTLTELITSVKYVSNIDIQPTMPTGIAFAFYHNAVNAAKHRNNE